MIPIDLTTTLPNKGSNGTRALAKISCAVVHHDAVPVTGPYDPVARYKSEAAYHISQGWKRLAYHIKIDAAGKVYLCSPLEEITYHAGNYPVNLVSIGICLDGDFSLKDPPYEQSMALIALLQNLCFHRPDMPLLIKPTVKGHREVRLLPTSCPGDHLFRILTDWRK